MSRNPNIPKDQISKYDYGRGPGKQERHEKHAGGGSDPEFESLREAVLKEVRNGMFTFEIPLFSAEPQNTSAYRDTAAYREAREKVEKYLLTTKHDTGWNDVIGNEAARTALIEAIEHPVKHADLYRHYGKKPLKGVLLYGPPGCGKTMFAKAAAGAIGRLYGTDATLLKINGPEIQSPYVGVTERIIRDIFAFARLYSKKHGHPLTIFIDEADSILPSRDGHVAPWEASNVATFLAEMDGLETSGAFVLLATNRPEAIDAALLRDGRCDRKIKVERPTRSAALAIVRNALETAPLAGQDVQSLAQASIEFFYSEHHVLDRIRLKRGKDLTEHPFRLCHIVNGAMLVGMVERAKGIAFRRDLAAGSVSGITLDDLRAAISEIHTENCGLNHAYALHEFATSIPTEVAVTLN